jgi:hypothetical protein
MINGRVRRAHHGAWDAPYENFKLHLAVSIVKETLIKCASHMVRQAHTQRVREPLRGHERNQKVTVRPEPFDKLRRALSKDFFRTYLTSVLLKTHHRLRHRRFKIFIHDAQHRAILKHSINNPAPLFLFAEFIEKGIGLGAVAKAAHGADFKIGIFFKLGQALYVGIFARE